MRMPGGRAKCVALGPKGVYQCRVMNTVASLFNLAGPDVVIILLVVLLLFGAKRLPELARGMGQAMNEFNKAKDDMHRQITSADQPAVRQPSEIREHRVEETEAKPQA